MDKKIIKKLKKQKYNIIFYSIIIILVIVIIVAFVNASNNKKEHVDKDQEQAIVTTTTQPTTLYPEDADFSNKLNAFANAHNLQLTDWTETLISRGEENPEIEDFVLNYPLKKDNQYNIDLSNFKDSKTVPLLIQWDERWGYQEYNSSIIGIAGCGPTCLSMVSIYLLNDTTLTPTYMAKFAQDNKYCYKNSGTSWDLMSKGGPKLGLKVKTIPNVKKKIVDNLELGNPIICNVGEGCFTKRGHYIVLSGYENGKIIVNDPNSPTLSKKKWDYDEFSGDIKNLWVFSK